jgi:lipoprotein-releasing system permease protein
MLSFSIASRFLRRSLGQTALITAGIAVGIAVQVFVGSLITSLQADLIDSTVGSSPHVTLLPDDDNSTVPVSLVDEALEDDRVTTAIPVRRLSAIYPGAEQSLALSMTAGAADDLDAVYDLEERMSSGEFRLDESEIVIGTGFAETSGLSSGDTVELVLPDGSVGAYAVAGVFDLGSAAANDRLAFLDDRSGAEALGQPADQYSAIEIQVEDVFASTEVAESLNGLPGVTVVEWQAENEELLSGLAAQSGSSLMIQTFVLVAVALGIASTLTVNAVQKTRQIGILKAMGMTDAAAGRIFLWQAALLGVGGVLLGIGLGYLLIWGFSFAPVDFSVRPQASLILISAAIGIAVALLSSILPSRSTSRLDPIEVIQGG